MPIIPIRVKSDAKLVRAGLQDLAKAIPQVGRLQIYQVMVRSRTRLKKPGKRVKYPVPWDNVKQKIKVIIMLKAANNLPYRRTGNYGNAFTITKLDDGYELGNTLDEADFVGGDAEGKNQSRIFRGRYPIMREVVDEEFKKLPSAVVEHLILVAAEKGLEAK